MRPARYLFPLAAIPALTFAGYWSLRLAWADHLSRAADPETVERGVRLAPGDADVCIRLANQREATGADPIPALEAAAALDPTNATVWVRLGLSAEMRGDPGAAEHSLLRAARASRQFEPRWTLANYYARRGDPAHFWPWAKDSLLMAYGDLNPVFQLCWSMSQESAVILERAVPSRRSVLNAYLGFLLRETRLAAAQPVAAKLAAVAIPEDRPALIAWCNRQLDGGSVPAALEIWNTLCTRRLLPYAPLDANRAPLTDGDFAAEPLGGGFAWRLAPLAGVAAGRNASPRYLWFSFNGEQPESCEPLTQLVPLAPGARYRLRFAYRTSEIGEESGLCWWVFDARTGASLAASPWLSSMAWKNAEMDFTTAPATVLVRLALMCRRLPGATRIEGGLSLRGLSLERLP
jgi:hypothetical protein